MKTGEYIFKYRWWLILVLIGLSLLAGSQLPKADIEPDIESLIPKNMESRINTDAIEEIFGSSDMLVIAFEDQDIIDSSSLKRLKAISHRLNRTEGINQVISLFDSKDIKGENGMIIVGPAVEKIPHTQEEEEQLKEKLRKNSLVYKIVISKDFKYSAIIVTINENLTDKELLEKIDTILNEYPGNENVYFGGMPFIREQISDEIVRNLIILLPVALILMVILLFFAFRQIRGVILPFTVVVLSMIVSMGLMPLLGWKITVITILLPIMLIAIANDYGIHLIARYQELVSANPKIQSVQLINQLIGHLWRPILFTGITSMAGMLGLLSHIIVPAKQLGLLAAIGIGWALLLSLLLLPAILIQLKKRTTSIFNSKIPGQSKILTRIGKKITKHPKRIIASTLILICFACIGITQLKVDGNTENFFGKKHPVRISSKIINDHFGGSQSLLIQFSGDIKDPGLLKKMDLYKKELENFPGVGNITSMADVIKEMSKAIYDKNEKEYNTIPDSREAVAQFLALYSMSGDPDDFEQIVDFPYENAQMIIRLDNGNSTKIKEVVRKIKDLTKNDNNVKRIGGYGYVTAELINTIIRGQVLSLSLSIIVVGLLIMLIFRSVRAGLITGITLLAATMLLFGLMGFLGIPLDAATAMLSSVMIGVGVDYTIHFLWRYKEERKLGLGYNEAVIKTLATTGRGITFNALSVMFGFSALLLSSFLPIKFFGFLILISIFSCLAAALVFIPAICIVLKPRFLEPDND